jgi:hypothetical protein
MFKSHTLCSCRSYSDLDAQGDGVVGSMGGTAAGVSGPVEETLWWNIKAKSAPARPASEAGSPSLDLMTSRGLCWSRDWNENWTP